MDANPSGDGNGPQKLNAPEFGRVNENQVSVYSYRQRESRLAALPLELLLLILERADSLSIRNLAQTSLLYHELFMSNILMSRMFAMARGFFQVMRLENENDRILSLNYAGMYDQISHIQNNAACMMRQCDCERLRQAVMHQILVYLLHGNPSADMKRAIQRVCIRYEYFTRLIINADENSRNVLFACNMEAMRALPGVAPIFGYTTEFGLDCMHDFADRHMLNVDVNEIEYVRLVLAYLPADMRQDVINDQYNESLFLMSKPENAGYVRRLDLVLDNNIITTQELLAHLSPQDFVLACFEDFDEGDVLTPLQYLRGRGILRTEDVLEVVPEIQQSDNSQLFLQKLRNEFNLPSN